MDKNHLYPYGIEESDITRYGIEICLHLHNGTAKFDQYDRTFEILNIRQRFCEHGRLHLC